MMSCYFTVNDNFEGIIKKHLTNIESISLVETGWTNFVYKVRSNNVSYVFRFPRNTFFSNVLNKEVTFSKFIKGKLSYNTTDLNLLYDNERPFTMHVEIPGNNMTEMYPSLTIEDKRRIANQVSNFIYELQNIDTSTLDIDLNTTSDFLIGLSKVDDQEYDLTKLNPLKELEKKKLTLSHADLNPGNILLDENKNVCGILDFAFVSYTSDLNDMARLIGRLPSDYYSIMLEEYNKRFNINVTKEEVDEIISVWNHVEHHYMIYMRNHHPEIKF